MSDLRFLAPAACLTSERLEVNLRAAPTVDRHRAQQTPQVPDSCHKRRPSSTLLSCESFGPAYHACADSCGQALLGYFPL
jgi:hypothetical protein